MFFHLYNQQECVGITSKKHIVFIVSSFFRFLWHFCRWRRKQDAGLTQHLCRLSLRSGTTAVMNVCSVMVLLWLSVKTINHLKLKSFFKGNIYLGRPDPECHIQLHPRREHGGVANIFQSSAGTGYWNEQVVDWKTIKKTVRGHLFNHPEH